MTVQELMDAMPYCNLAEIVIRKTGHGQWIQGYRIGKEAEIYCKRKERRTLPEILVTKES